MAKAKPKKPEPMSAERVSQLRHDAIELSRGSNDLALGPMDYTQLAAALAELLDWREGRLVAAPTFMAPPWRNPVESVSGGGWVEP